MASAAARGYHELVRKMQQVGLLDSLSKLKKPTGVAAKVQAQGGPEQVKMEFGGAASQNSNSIRGGAAPVDVGSGDLREHQGLERGREDPEDARHRVDRRERARGLVLGCTMPGP